MLLLAAAVAVASAQSLSPAEAAAIGKRAIAMLGEYAQDGDAEARALVAAAWGRIGNQAAEPFVRKALKDKNVIVRIEAATSLHMLGDDNAAGLALEKIIVKVSTPSAGATPQQQLRQVAREQARAKAIARLSEFGGEDAATLFESTVQDRSSIVRDATNLALARMGLDEFGKPYLDAAKDEDAGVRAAAARSLGEIGRPEYLAAVRRLAKDDSVDVRLEAVEALSHFSGAEAAAPLMAALRDQDARVRAKALAGLAKIPDPLTTPALREALKTAKTPEASLRAAAGLAVRGQTVDLGVAERTLRAKDPDLKMLALEVLAAAPGDEATLLLKRVMDEETDTRLKLTAAAALVKKLQRRGA